MGVDSLASNNTGMSNTGLGHTALSSNTIGVQNSAVGGGALFANSIGSFNNAFGVYSLTSNISGNRNNAIGVESLRLNTTGSNNSAFGTYAGYNATGASSGNIFIGYNAGPSIGTSVSDQLYIHNAAGTPTIYGNLSTKSVAINATVFAGQQFYVNGPAGGTTAWSNLSDLNLKNVEGNFEEGLSQIIQLNPIYYTFKTDNPLGISDTNQYVGFGAQDVLGIIPEAVKLTSDGYYTLNTNPILAAMVNATKEINTRILGIESTDAESIGSFWNTNSSGELETTLSIVVSILKAESGFIKTISSDKITVMDIEVENLLSSSEIETDMIRSLSGNDIAIQLNDSIGDMSFKILDSQGVQVFGVNSKGDVDVKGDVDIKGNLSVGNETIGSAIIPSGEMDIIINSTTVKPNSKVFLTLTTDTEAIVVLKVVEKLDGKFKVKLSQTDNTNITFDWWVIN